MVEPECRVRRGDASDGVALAELRWAWRVTDRGEQGMSHDDFVRAFAGWISEHRRSHLPFLAEEGPVAVGMAWLAVVERVPGPGLWTRLAGQVQSVYVLPAHRGRGVGASLVAAAINEAVADDLDYLGVHPSERSFSLYRRIGFAEHAGVLELDLRSLRT